MFYEFTHSHSNFSDYYKIEKNSDFSYPHHMHQGFEIILVTNGEITVSVGESQKELHKNDAAIIFPNQIHSMSTVKNSSHTLCIFSEHFVRKFSGPVSGMHPENNFISLPSNMADMFAGLNQDDNICFIAGVLYMILGTFDAGASYIKGEKVFSEDLFHKIFTYINTNENCTMKELAKHTGYDYAYLSKLFKKVVGISFKSYINELKITKARELLIDSDKTILELSEECGYESLRSFNRNFREVMGISPSEFRKNAAR